MSKVSEPPSPSTVYGLIFGSQQEVEAERLQYLDSVISIGYERLLKEPEVNENDAVLFQKQLQQMTIENYASIIHTSNSIDETHKDV